MKFRIEFDTDNAAFAEHGEEEFDYITGQIDYHRTRGVLRDSNGNKVGQWVHEEV